MIDTLRRILNNASTAASNFAAHPFVQMAVLLAMQGARSELAGSEHAAEEEIERLRAGRDPQ